MSGDVQEAGAASAGEAAVRQEVEERLRLLGALRRELTGLADAVHGLARLTWAGPARWLMDLETQLLGGELRRLVSLLESAERDWRTALELLDGGTP
ncbi:MAG: hypothetical protein Q4E05_09720 [Pseudoclavibacter sp.]|nr:hypothetical protein [Pseudoclavibacter sp.]